MKPSHYLVGLIFFTVACIGAYFVTRSRAIPDSGSPPVAKAEVKPPKFDNSRTEFPKVKLEEESYDFGIIEVGEKGQHEFVIQNVGKAPLLLTKGTTTCQCTVLGDMAGEIAPGESGKVTLSWEPTAATDAFDKWAEIHTNETNEPKKNVIRLHVRGEVTTRILTFPVGNWGPVEVKEEGPTEIKGRIVTQLNETFEITEVAVDNPLVTSETRVLTKDDMSDLGPAPKFGYEVKFALQPGLPVGAYAVPFRIKTDLKSKKTGEPLEYPLFLWGTRRGPFHIVAPPTLFVEDKGIISLGVFSAEKGKKVTMQLLAKGVPEEGLRIEDKEVRPASLKVDLVADESFKSPASKKYRLEIEFPPSKVRPIEFGEETPGLIKLRTNHPTAPDMQFKVFISAR